VSRSGSTRHSPSNPSKPPRPGLSLADALLLGELLAKADPARYERAALRWLQRFIDERLPPTSDVAFAASAISELRHGRRGVGAETLKQLLGAKASLLLGVRASSLSLLLRSGGA
jgi:hypothetical protein